jgi:hypothetical protein
MIRLFTTPLRSALHRRPSSPMSVALFGCEGGSRLSFERFFDTEGFGSALGGILGIGTALLASGGLGVWGLSTRNGMHQGCGKSTVQGFVVTGTQLIPAISGILMNLDRIIPCGRCRPNSLALM